MRRTRAWPQRGSCVPWAFERQPASMRPPLNEAAFGSVFRQAGCRDRPRTKPSDSDKRLNPRAPWRIGPGWPERSGNVRTDDPRPAGGTTPLRVAFERRARAGPFVGSSGTARIGGFRGRAFAPWAEWLWLWLWERFRSNGSMLRETRFPGRTPLPERHGLGSGWSVVGRSGMALLGGEQCQTPS